MVDYLNWFEFLGRNSQDFGIVITDYDAFSSPQRETATVKIFGRNGDIIQSNNRYDNVSVSYHCVLLPHERWHSLEQQINAVKLWLNGSVDGYSELTDSYNSNVYRMAHFDGAIKPTKQGTVWGFDVNFSCEPFRYGIETERVITIPENGLTLNLTDYEAVYGIPLITLYPVSGGTTMTFSLNNTNWFTVSDKKTFIDSKAGKVYDVDGNFRFYHNGNASTFIAPKGMPILNNGENVLEVSEPETSGIFKIAIWKRWCYL